LARIGLVLLSAALFAVQAAAQTIDGKLAHVRDADTIELATSRGRIAIRLNGVDAPELGERGGRAGKRWMARAYGGQPLRCVLNGDRTYDRLVGVCYDRNGADIGAAVIAAGHARDCPRFSGGRYRKFETKASRAIPSKPYCK
jgi:endonuclease YncB( thermonuclease family)